MDYVTPKKVFIKFFLLKCHDKVVSFLCLFRVLVTHDTNYRYLYLSDTQQNPMRWPKIELADKHFMSGPELIYREKSIWVRKKEKKKTHHTFSEGLTLYLLSSHSTILSYNLFLVLTASTEINVQYPKHLCINHKFDLVCILVQVFWEQNCIFQVIATSCLMRNYLSFTVS